MDIKTRGSMFAIFLAARLKEAVEENGITQRQLAAAIGTTAAQINKYLNADRVLLVDFYSRICAAIDHDPAEIVDRAYQGLLDLEAGKRLDPRIMPIWKLAAKNPGYSIEDQLKGEADNQP